MIPLCYCPSDRGFAKRICSDLAENDIDVQFESWELQADDSIVERIDSVMERMEGLLLILSPKAVQCDWIAGELSTALIRRLNEAAASLLPIVCTPCAVPALLSDTKHADFTEDYESGMVELLGALGKQLSGRPKYDRFAADYEQGLSDNAALIDNVARQLETATEARSVPYLLEKLNRLLKLRRRYCALLGLDVEEDRFRLAGQTISADMVAVGHLVAPPETIGRVTDATREYCPKCHGLINVAEVAPDLPWYLLSDAGCICP